MRIVVVDPDEVRARENVAALEAEGLSAVVASSQTELRALRSGADVLLVAPTTSADMLAETLGLDVPIALLDEGSAVPASLVRAVPVALLPVGRGAVRALLEDALAQRRGDGQALQRLRRLAYVDGVTGVHNQAYLWEALPRELEWAQRTGTTLAVLWIDIDGFRRWNDHFGHGEGDRLLRGVAETLGAALRPGDTLARWNCDDFFAVLPRTEVGTAAPIAERMRAKVAALKVDRPGATPVRSVTVSIGVAMSGGRLEGVETAGDLLRRAENLVRSSQGRSWDVVRVEHDEGGTLPF